MKFAAIVAFLVANAKGFPWDMDEAQVGQLPSSADLAGGMAYGEVPAELTNLQRPELPPWASFNEEEQGPLAEAAKELDPEELLPTPLTEELATALPEALATALPEELLPTPLLEELATALPEELPTALPARLLRKSCNGGKGCGGGHGKGHAHGCGTTHGCGHHSKGKTLVAAPVASKAAYIPAKATAYVPAKATAYAPSKGTSYAPTKATAYVPRPAYQIQAPATVNYASSKKY